jgi:hypothetical protein
MILWMNPDESVIVISGDYGSGVIDSKTADLCGDAA